jgi:hypothetical protein
MTKPAQQVQHRKNHTVFLRSHAMGQSGFNSRWLLATPHLETSTEWWHMLVQPLTGINELQIERSLVEVRCKSALDDWLWPWHLKRDSSAIP